MTLKETITKPKITVITVVLNDCDNIETTLKSVIEQTYDNLEYIVIDGGSKDGTQDIIRQYESKITHWISEKDAGIYYAMNKGIQIATGDWVNFMNSGDTFYSNDTIELVEGEFDTDTVYGNHVTHHKKTNDYITVDATKKNDRWNIPFCHQSLFTRREILLLFPFDTSYQIAADYNQYLEIKNNNISRKHISFEVSYFKGQGLSVKSKNIWIKEHRKIHRKYFPLTADILYLMRLVKLKLTRR